MISVTCSVVALIDTIYILQNIYGVSFNQPGFARDTGWVGNMVCIVPIVVCVVSFFIVRRLVNNREQDVLARWADARAIQPSDIKAADHE